MKLVRATQERYVFELGRREKRLLLDLLRHYPVVPSTHHRVSKSGPTGCLDAQQVLDECLAEQRTASRKHVESLLVQPERFTSTALGDEFTLTPSDMELLLQVLNDIRVGHWIRLGSPGPREEATEVSRETAAAYFAMEACGYFQMVLLNALEANTPD